MASAYQDGYGLRYDTLTIGLSTIAHMTTIAGQQSVRFSFATAGASLLYGGASTTWGSGYPVVGEQILNNYRGNIYFAAAGATITLNILRFLTISE